MVHRKHCVGYEECLKSIKEISDERPDDALFIFFTGSKDGSGKSWCPDCREGEKMLEKYVPTLSTNVTFLEVDVGPRAYWKDPSNPFRKDKDFHLKYVPTLILWKKNRRLEEANCYNEDMVQMFFEDISS